MDGKPTNYRKDYHLKQSGPIVDLGDALGFMMMRVGAGCLITNKF